MRKSYMIGALVGAMALVFAAVSFAATSPQFKQVAKITYSTSKARSAAGTKATLIATDPGAVPAGSFKGAAKVVIAFPGAKIDTKAGKQCKLQKASAASCPASTKVGSGTASANLVGGSSVTPGIKQKVTAYLAKGSLYFVVKGVTLPTTTILQSSFSKGKLTTNVARDVPPLPGGNKIVLTDFRVTIKKVTSGKGKKRRALITTPKCGKSKKFSIVTSFTYDDGSKATVKSSQKCKK